MDRRVDRMAVNGRPSGIRPPTNFRSTIKARPSVGINSMRAFDGIPSSNSSRKGVFRPANNGNAPGSGGSMIGGGRVSGMSSMAGRGSTVFGGSKAANSNAPGSGGSLMSGRRMSGLSSMSSRVSNVFGGLKSMSSARKSNATARLGPLFGSTPQHKRSSFMANTCSSSRSSRRGSSIGGSRHFQDNRPLTEVSYHRQCANKLVEFLTENNYPHQINKRLYSHPTNTDIIRIFEFLLSFYGFRSKITPIETEIPKILLQLEYPYSIKKSDFVSFTGGRALGSLLGCIEWLVDSLKYCINMDPVRTFFPNFDGEIDVRYELLKLTLSNEVLSSDVGDNTIKQLQSLAIDKYGTEEDYGQLLDEQEKLEQEINRLDIEISDISDVPNSVQAYQNDIQCYEKYIIEMQAHNSSNENAILVLEKESEEKCAALKKLEEQKKALICQVEAQEFGIEEAELARQRKLQIDEEVKQEAIVLEDLKKSIRLTKLECSKYEDMLKKMYSDSQSYINTMKDLVNSPLMINFTNSLKKMLDNDEWLQISNTLDDLKSGKSGANISDFEKLFSSNVNELKITTVELLSALQGSVSLSEQQRNNELDLVIEDIDKQVIKAETKVQSLVEEVDTQRKAQQSELSSLQSEIDSNRQLLSELDGSSKTSHKEYKEAISKLKKQIRELHQQNTKKENDMINEWEEIITKRKDGFKQITENLDAMKGEQKETNSRLKHTYAKSMPVTRVTRQRTKEHAK